MIKNEHSYRLQKVIDAFNGNATDFAKSIPRAKSSIYMILNGKRNIGKGLAEAIQRVHKVSMAWLLHGTGEMLLPTAGSEKEVAAMSENPQSHATRLLMEIFDSKDEDAISAIVANLEYFSKAVRRAQADRRKVVDPAWAEKHGGYRRKANQG